LTPEQADLLWRARRSVAAAKLLLEAGYADVAVSQAYYAMFYSASALLRGEGLTFSKHSAVIAAFGQHFARTGKVPEELHKALIAAEKARRDADYVVSRRAPEGDAEQQIASAERFLAVAEELTGGPTPEAG